MSSRGDFIIDDDEDPFADNYKLAPSSSTLLGTNTRSSLIATPFTQAPSAGLQFYTPAPQRSPESPVLPTNGAFPNSSYVGVDLSSTKTDSLAQKEEILRRKEAELAVRERTLQQQQEYLRRVGTSAKPPNWPPFYPIVHHDIQEDVPEQHRRIVTKVFYLWLASEGLLILNMFACLGILIAHPPGLPGAASDFGVSFVYIFTITAGSFFLWWRPAYLAFSKNSSFFYFVFFIFIGCHILFCYYMAVGIPGSGAAGFINMLGAITGGAVGTGVVCIIVMALWILIGTYSLWTMREVYAIFGAGGHSFESAKNEAIAIGVSNPTTSNLAQSAATNYFASSGPPSHV
ncbi:hypothetical protein SmJEL517_g03379 [Synchytrium microbalum]|uniref:Secretory carrier membrane protein n=1 Tax=Synchytrium microbalum TaxID=1806994 RepID=A0A507C3B4_9FUNG|nr:uncharacterized protein SmJEL517_g03379 [Synchytrium microbalum]TPX33868.1 hypothetical protein SmJEL517_g03379 [Synchytrium microbalum]